MGKNQPDMIDSGRECLLCRPGGLVMTKRLFRLAGLWGRAEALAVADVGCGAGAAMDYLKENHPTWRIRGIDPNPSVYREGEIVTGTAEALPFGCGELDAVLMECSFSKTGNPGQALKEAFRVLKPDGWLLLSDMYARKKELTAEAGGVLGRLECHKTIWKRLRAAGFSVLEMEDASVELTQWMGQKIMDGEAESLYESLGVERAALREAGCGYFFCAAQPSDLWRTLDYAAEKSRFYQEQWAAAGEKIPPGDWNAFLSLPFTTPEDVRENPERFVCVHPKEIARIITLRTSGSQGKPKRLFFTEGDLMRTADFFEKGMQYMIKPGGRITAYMEGPGLFSIGGLLKEGLSRISVEVTVHGLIRDMEAAAEDGRDRDCFVGVPSQMYGLAARAPWLRPSTVLLSADYVPESVKNFLEETWQCRVFTHWGMTETGYGGGVQCGAREGCHMRDNDLLLEVIDPESGKPVEDGQYGELVLTTLHRLGMPLIRYRTGDLGRFLTEPCGCGCLKPRLDKVEGRLDDCLRLENGKVLSMHLLDELLFAIQGVRDFEAVLDRKERRLFIYVLGKEKQEQESRGRELLLARVREVLLLQFGSSLSVEVAEKEISPYIGSGKRKMQEMIET